MTESETRKRYSGAAIDVTFDPRLCAHAGECVRGLPSVFDVQARPWIRPDGADASAVTEVVGRCPSGALEIADPTGPAPG
jgi:uncharacterized Fe-S cluster protein YjdI